MKRLKGFVQGWFNFVSAVVFLLTGAVFGPLILWEDDEEIKARDAGRTREEM